VNTRASFARELSIYVGRMRTFDRADWVAYVAWVGMMVALVVATSAFLVYGHAHGAQFPTEAWLVPLGAGTFAVAIAIDTIGHRTVYRAAIGEGEGLVHRVTIVFGVASCVLLCAAYEHRALLWIPAAVATVLSFVYSLVDEAFHWRRYVAAHSDRVEMASHALILFGHATMMLGWWRWFALDYAGVTATVAAWTAR
jgi:hypothetical protein